MGADGHIYVLKVLDRNWYESEGKEELRNFVEDYYEREVRGILGSKVEPYLFMPYFYKDFAGIKGFDVLIIYWDSENFNWRDVDLEAIESKEFAEKFRGKFQFVGEYEVWT